MGSYADRDLGVADDGDLIVGANGDLSIAAADLSMKHALKFMISTDFQEVAPQPLMGANLGSLIGNSDISDVLEQIPTLIAQGNDYSRLINSQDVKVTAIPIDVDQVYIAVEITGTFLNVDGYPLDRGVIYIEYVFPYTAEKIQDLT